NTEFLNNSNNKLTLLKAMSLQLDLPDSQYDFIQFSGAWLRERQLYRTSLRPGIQAIDSLRYSSSPQQNPFFMLSRRETTEHSGEVYGFNFIYSGNFQNMIEVDHFDTARVTVGINPVEFRFLLNPAESFVTPEAIVIYSDQGMNQMSQQLSDFYRHHLVNPNFSQASRPIILNSWETFYFDLSTEKILDLAKAAKDLGIELFVLDDGWFGHRKDDKSSLGDWVTDRSRLPEGIGFLADEIHKIGLQFGLWFEPEMISIDSDLYKNHADWTIHLLDREKSVGRNQYVLDLTRQEVVDYLFDSISKIIIKTNLDYIKWDMNRHITDIYSIELDSEQQMEFGHRYILGLYQLLDRLITKFPSVLFESCSSGGGRFDLGLMYYAPQAWTSDDTDPIERLKIQHGTSYGYSPSMMTAHVSISPNEQSGRQTSLDTRTNVAYFSSFGYELDVTRLSVEEKEQVREQIQFYKKYRSLFQYGDFYRINSPFSCDSASWQVVSKDKCQSILLYAQLNSKLNPGYTRVYFSGLDKDKCYSVSRFDEFFYGDELMNAGIKVSLSNLALCVPEYLTKLFVIEEVVCKY
ncbi:TPA: alpha-galactosidase, partial [Streptococcus pneumoniae]